MFEVQSTATVFSLEISAVTRGSETIPIAFVVDRDFFGPNFPTRGNDIVLTSNDPSTCGTSSGTNIRLYILTDPEVEASTDAVYGPIITINDSITFNTPDTLQPGTHSCTFFIQLDPFIRNILRNPFFTASIVYQPGIVGIAN